LGKRYSLRPLGRSGRRRKSRSSSRSHGDVRDICVGIYL
jgi:hypothetical protein